MVVQMFNLPYFLWIFLSAGLFFGLYFLLKNRTERTQRIVLFSILVFALLLHFLKAFIPPYSTDPSRLHRDIWFINICGANIFLFPFLFVIKNETLHDYMFYIGVFSGFLATLYPTEALDRDLSEILDITRFYVHHAILWIVPLLMVLLGLHKLNYRRVIRVGPCLLGLFVFILLNQIIQQEIGFTPVRGFAGELGTLDVYDITDIGYKNTSYIWGADADDPIGMIFDIFCPKIFKTIPVGKYKGQRRHWPFIWLIVPVMVIITPLCFAVSMIFDRKHFVEDMGRVKIYLKARFELIKSKRK